MEGRHQLDIDQWLDLLHQQTDHTMSHTHQAVSQPHGLPLESFEDPLQEDHPEEVRVSESYISRGGAEVWEGCLRWAGDVEHPAHSLQSHLNLGKQE